MTLDEPHSTAAEAFRTIRTALTFSDAGDGLRSLLLTSSVPMEGKTLISVNLAIALATSGRRVLLVDADLRRPRLTKVLSPGRRHGLSSLLIGAPGVTLESAVQPTDLDTLHILPSGPVPPNPAELLGGERMKPLLEEMKSKYDTVFFDTPPVISATDSTVLCQIVDGALLVIRAFTTQRDLALRARDTLVGARGRLLGTILNSVDAPRKSGSSYGGYYHSKYYDYYGMDDKDRKGGKRRRRARKRSGLDDEPVVKRRDRDALKIIPGERDNATSARQGADLDDEKPVAFDWGRRATHRRGRPGPGGGRGMIDLHVHVLPGIDDGPETLDEALDLCERAHRAGTRTLVATPHLLTGAFPDVTPGKIRDAVTGLSERLIEEGIDIMLLPGAEVRIHPDLPRLAEAGRVLTLGGRGPYLLLEFPMNLVPPGPGPVSLLDPARRPGAGDRPPPSGTPSSSSGSRPSRPACPPARCSRSRRAA